MREKWEPPPIAHSLTVKYIRFHKPDAAITNQRAFLRSIAPLFPKGAWEWSCGSLLFCVLVPGFAL